MSEFISRPRNLIFSASILILAVACTLAIWHVAPRRAHALLGGEPANSTVLCALTSAGIDIDALAAAGVTSYDVQQLVTSAQQYVQVDNRDYSALLESRGQWRSYVDQLQRRIQAGTATVGEIDAYAQAASELANVESAFSSYLEDLYAAATANLTLAQRTCLAALNANDDWRSAYNLEFLTVDRSQAEWVQLRDALANERIAYANGEYPDYDAQAFLSAARSDVTVATAATNHQAYYTNVAYAWDNALLN